MLSNNAINQFLTLIANQEQQLNLYSPTNALYNTEAYLTLFEIKTLLKNHPEDLAEQLVQFLKARWQRIQSTNCQYLHDFTSPANLVCIAIADHLSKITLKSSLCLLMPTLEAVKAEEYLTASYTDTDFSMQELILSDNNQRTINILDVLDSAREDGFLKYNSLVAKKIKALSSSEVNRLITRHPSVKLVLDALTARILYKMEGDTVGAAVNRLIRGLRNGGANVKTNYAQELNATEFSSGMDANVEILNFALYLETLDVETKNQLLSASKTDRYMSSRVEKTTIGKLWKNLVQPKDGAQSTTYCVEIIASLLEEVLNENPGLYDLVSYNGSALGNLAKLNEELINATKKMKAELLTIKFHFCYDDQDSCLQKRVLEDLMKKRVHLRATEIQSFTKLYHTTANDPELLVSIRDLFKSNFCPGTELKKLDAKEREDYYKINPPSKDPFLTASGKRVFTKDKRKFKEPEKEEPEEEAALPSLKYQRL